MAKVAFLGLGVNYTNFFNTEADQELKTTLVALGAASANDPVSIKLKNSWGLAAQAGVNIKLADNLGVHLMISKIDIDTKAHVRVNGNTVQSVDVNIDPLVAMIGLRDNPVEHQGDCRRLARAARTDHRHALTGAEVEIDAAKHRLIGPCRLQSTAAQRQRRTRHRLSLAWVVHGIGRAEDLIQPLRGAAHALVGER